MPYVKREQYLNWRNWVLTILSRLNDKTTKEFTLGYRGRNHKICLIDLFDDYPVAYGMKNITHYILELQRRYDL